MDDKNKLEGEQQPQPSKKEQEKQNSRDVVNTVGKEAGKTALEAHGVPPVVSDLAVDKVADHPMVKKTLNKVADHPAIRKPLSRAKPLVDTAKPLLNAKKGLTSGGAGVSERGAPVPETAPKGADSPNESPMPSAGGSSGQIPGLGGSGNTADIADKAMKVKKYWPIITAVAPILVWFLLAIVAIIIIMMPIMYIAEKKEEALDTIDKFINFITLEGWGDSETLFFKNLKEEYDWYETLNNKEGELDIPLIAATIHYGTIVKPESYQYDDSDKYTEYKYNDKDPVIPSNQLRSFYIVANDKVGKADPIYLGEKKLLGHLVDIKFTTKCLDTPPSIIEAIFTGEWDEWGELGEEARKSFEDFWNVLKHSLVDNVTLTVKKGNVIKTAQLMIEYAKQDQNKFVADIGNEFHELKHDNALRRLYDIVKNSDLTNTCGEDQISIPIMTRFINYERYKTYLRETFLPLEPYNDCKGCVYKNADTDRQEVLIERMITEIFDQKKTYEHLKGDKGESDNINYAYVPGPPTFPIPLNSEGKFRISSKFGMRHHPIYNDYRMHKGIDLPRAHGQPVYSIADGEVIHAGCQANGCALGYGKYVLIQHDVDGNGEADYYTLYAHLSVINTVKGAKVGGGQKIGEIGSTGASTGPHLHLEIQDEKRNPIDPEPILNGIIKGNSVFDNTPTTTYYN